jgi:histone acetyltransferase MYST1
MPHAVGSRAKIVSTIDGRARWATIVARKAAKDPSFAASASPGNGGGGVRYYVRYDGEDARMDAWVKEEAVAAWEDGVGDDDDEEEGEDDGHRRGLGEPRSPGSARGGSGRGNETTMKRMDASGRSTKKRALTTTTTDARTRTASPVSKEEDGKRRGTTIPTTTTNAHGTREHGGSGEAREEEEEEAKIRSVNWIELGRYVCDCWYDSPFPEEFTDENKLFVCEFCLKYHRKRKAYISHKKMCELRRPPGDEIYRHPAPTPQTTPDAGDGERPGRNQLRMWEVDGSNATTYCQNLCLIAKLFLDHKTLYYDVAAFHFYVLTEQDFDAEGVPMHRIVGYFSKEKGQVDTNLACILTLPPYQRRGYGAFLIAFSYELSRREGRIGTPERPLSDLGYLSYKSYWSRAVLEALNGTSGEVSVNELSKKTNIRVDDIVATLQSHSSVRFFKDQGYMNISEEGIAALQKLRGKAKKYEAELKIIPARLKWTPHQQAMVEVNEKRRRTRLFVQDEAASERD